MLAFPGMITKKVNMTAFNTPSRPVQDRRMLGYYALIGSAAMPPFAKAPNLHACAHLYASDRNSLFLSASMLEIDGYLAMASLSHTVVFHTTGATLDTTDTVGKERWVMQEARTDRLEDERITYHSRIWDDTNRHIATVFQNGMVRWPPKSRNKL